MAERKRDRKKKEQESAEAISGLKKLYLLEISDEWTGNWKRYKIHLFERKSQFRT